MRKFAGIILLISALVLGSGGPTAAAKKPVPETKVLGALQGWADGGSFEVKTSKGEVLILRTTNNWYKKHLIEGKSYKFFYIKNKHGQYIVTKIWK